MLFQKYIDNPKNFRNGTFTSSGANKFLVYGGGVAGVFGAAVQKATGVLEKTLPVIKDWDGLAGATEKCFAKESGRSILQKVQDFSLADIDPSAVAGCINSKYAEEVTSIALQNAYVVPTLTGLMGVVAGVAIAYSIGVNIENKVKAKSPTFE